MPGLPLAVRGLVFQLRIIYTELALSLPDGDAPLSALIQYGKRYLVEMCMCADALGDEADAAEATGGRDEDVEELRAELQRTRWAACIWELATIMLVKRPLVAGERQPDAARTPLPCRALGRRALSHSICPPVYRPSHSLPPTTHIPLGAPAPANNKKLTAPSRLPTAPPTKQTSRYRW